MTAEGVTMDTEGRLVKVEEGLANVVGGLARTDNALTVGLGKVDAAIERLSSKLEQSGKPQWTVIIGFGTLALGFVSLFGGTVGVLSYGNISAAQERLGVTMGKIDDRTSAGLQKLDDKITAGLKDTLTRDELEYRAARSAEDRRRVEATLADLRAQMHDGFANRDRRLDRLEASRFRD